MASCWRACQSDPIAKSRRTFTRRSRLRLRNLRLLRDFRLSLVVRLSLPFWGGNELSAIGKSLASVLVRDAQWESWSHIPSPSTARLKYMWTPESSIKFLKNRIVSAIGQSSETPLFPIWASCPDLVVIRCVYIPIMIGFLSEVLQHFSLTPLTPQRAWYHKSQSVKFLVFHSNSHSETLKYNLQQICKPTFLTPTLTERTFVARVFVEKIEEVVLLLWKIHG